MRRDSQHQTNLKQRMTLYSDICLSGEVKSTELINYLDEENLGKCSDAAGLTHVLCVQKIRGSNPRSGQARLVLPSRRVAKMRSNLPLQKTAG